MKKIMQLVMMAVVACFFAVGAGSVGQVEAAALYTPATYWNGNANYPVAFTQAGVNRYVDLSSAKVEEQTENVEDNIKTAIFTYDVIMVNEQGVETSKFSYRTMIKFVGDEVSIFSARRNNDGWAQLSDRSFDQPQYNAAQILAEHFNINK